MKPVIFFFFNGFSDILVIFFNFYIYYDFFVLGNVIMFLITLKPLD